MDEVRKALQGGFTAEEVATAKKAYRDAQLVSRSQDSALLSLLVAVAIYCWALAKPNELETIRADAFATLGYVANWRAIFAHSRSGSSVTFSRLRVPMQRNVRCCTTSSSMSYCNANLKTCHALARYAAPCKTNRIICSPSCARLTKNSTPSHATKTVCGSRARDLRTASQAGNVNRVLARLEPAVCRHGQQVSCGVRRRLTSHAGHAAQ